MWSEDNFHTVIIFHRSLEIALKIETSKLNFIDVQKREVSHNILWPLRLRQRGPECVTSGNFQKLAEPHFLICKLGKISD